MRNYFKKFIAVLVIFGFGAEVYANRCLQGEHWVNSHNRRGYYRGNGTFVKAAHVKAHCQGNPPSYHPWNIKLMDERPLSWRHQKEVSVKWSSEERERVLEALDETPDLLKDKNINGIYRMKMSEHPKNPASNNYSDIVLYDNAFDADFVLTHVLNHELAHRVYENLSDGEKVSFRSTAKWGPDRQRTGMFLPGRPEKEFLRENDLLSPVEDFSDSVVAYFHEPERLKKISTPIYNWMNERFGSKKKSGGNSK